VLNAMHCILGMGAPPSQGGSGDNHLALVLDTGTAEGQGKMWKVVESSRTVARKFSIEGFAVLRGGFALVRGGLDIIKLTKILLIYSVSRFNLGGLKLCLGGLSPPKPPVATGLDSSCTKNKWPKCMGLFMLYWMWTSVFCDVAYDVFEAQTVACLRFYRRIAYSCTHQRRQL